MTFPWVLLPWPELHHTHFLVSRNYARAIVGGHRDSLYMDTSHIGGGVSQAMYPEWKHCFLNSCCFNSFHYLGIWVVVYGACLNSGSLFRLLFTKQVCNSQRHGEVKLFPPVIHSSVEELSSSRMWLCLERVPDSGQLQLSIHLPALLSPWTPLPLDLTCRSFSRPWEKVLLLRWPSLWYCSVLCTFIACINIE